MTDGMGTFEYTLDVMQRVTSEEYYDDSRLRYWYNNAGQRTKLDYKANNGTTYSPIYYYYDDGGALTKIDWDDANGGGAYETDIYATYGYDDANRLTKRHVNALDDETSNEAEIETCYYYDVAGQVTRLIHENDDNPIDLDDRDFTYSYDSRGNRTKVVLNDDADKKI